MKSFRLSNEEAANTGFSHKAIIELADIVALGANLVGVIVVGSYTAGTLFRSAAHKVVTPLDGGATTNARLDLGWNGGTTDDDDGLITNREVHVDATEVLYGDGNGAAFATLRTGYAALDDGTLEVKLTAIGANLNAITQGEIHVYWGQTDLTKV